MAFKDTQTEVVRGIIPDSVLSVYQDYALRRFFADELQRFDNAVVPNFPSDCYNDPLTSTIHNKLILPALEKVLGIELSPTYCYLRVYENPAILLKHTDRAECEISVSLSVWNLPEGVRWSLYAESDGEVIETILDPGDILVYHGIDLPHWREAMAPNQQVSISAFFHFVRKDGEFADKAGDPDRCAKHKHNRGYKNLEKQAILGYEKWGYKI